MEVCFISRRALHASAVSMMLFWLGQVALASPTETPATPLETGQQQVAEMTAGKPLEFTLEAEAGNLYLLTIDEAGFELLVDVTYPGGRAERFDFPTYRDDPTHRDESERLLLEPRNSGPLYFSISTEDKNGHTGRPRLSVARLDPSDPLATPLRLLTRAAAVYAEGDWEAALALLEQAEPLLKRAGDPALLGRSRMAMAILHYWEAYDYQNGLKWFALAEQSFLQADAQLQASLARQFQGTIRVDMAFEVEKTPTEGLAPEAQMLFDEALEILADVLAIQDTSAAGYETAGTINLTGFAYHMMGDYDKAFEHYSEAADRYHELMAWDAEVWPVNNMGVIQFDRGYLNEAAEYFMRYPDSLAAYMMENLAAAYLALGELDEALKYFSRALDLNRVAESEDGMGRSLQGIGDTYLAYGETALGVEHLEAALPHRRKAKDGPGLVSLLNSLGRQYLQRGDFESALAAHEEALGASVDPADVARTHLRLAEYRLAIDEPQTALTLLDTARSIEGEIGQRILQADIQRLSGEAQRAAGEFAAALQSYRSAEPIYAEVGLFNKQAQSLFGMSLSLADLGRPEESVEFAERAIEIAESHRSTFRTPQLRSFYMAQRQNYYVHLIGTLVELHRRGGKDDAAWLRQALAVSERSRARALVDLLNEAAQLNTGNGDREERDALLRQLAEARYRLQGGSAQPMTAGETLEARQRLSDLENRLNLMEIRRRETNPAYARLVDPTLLDADGVQAMLDEDTALLQYTLGEDFGFVFLVTADDIEAWTLPSSTEIEQVARPVYESLRSPPATGPGSTAWSQPVEALARIVLPPEEALEKTRVLVVADGVLQYLPFSVLLGERRGNPRGSAMGFEIVNVPSMSMLATQRDSLAGRDEPAFTLALYADPVFSLDDQRLAEAIAESPAFALQPVSRQPADQVEPRNLPRLPATRYEADTIAELIAPEQRVIRTGFDANRDAILNRDLADFRVVHFATHGKVDSRYPSLSWLAFSQFDAQANAREGLLRLHDIYELDLAADLVTMSACDTALGREIRGEGLAGLVQGFMYAGARSVLASLWQVPDRATAEFMSMFYQNLLERNQRPAEALFNAQRELSEKPRWRHPYFWGAFVLQGDWR